MNEIKQYPLLRLLKVLTNFTWYASLILGSFAVVVYLFGLIFEPLSIHTFESIRLPVKFENNNSTSEAVSLIPEFSIEEYSMLTETLNLNTDNTFYEILLSITTLINFFIVLFVIYQFKNIFENLSSRQPFNKTNIKRIQTSGIAIIAFEIFVTIKYYVMSIFMSDRFDLGGSDFSFSQDFSQNTIYVGLAFLLLAEIFKDGLALHEDRKLTI